MLAKKLRTFVFLKDLGLSLKKSALFYGEEVILLKELWPFLKENSLLLEEAFFFITWRTCLGLTFSFLFLEEVTSERQLI